MKRILFAFLIVVLTAGIGLSQDPADTIITEGQFAVKLTQILKAQTPEGEIDEQSAVTFLESIGIAPREGWNISASLTEKALSELVKPAGVDLTPIQPNSLVTVAKANYVIRRYSKLFREYYLVRYNADNSTDSAIADEGAIIPPAVSPGAVK